MRITEQQLRRIVGRLLREASSRPVYDIADEIMKSWPRVSGTAKSYLKAMKQISSVSDTYGHDDGREIVLKFLDLPEVHEWKGSDADRLKSDLKAAMRVI